MQNVIDWIGKHWVEVLAVLVSITYVILTVRQIIWLWLFGLLSALLYAWVYGHAGFYAGMALQGYYAGISIYGWIHWKRKSALGNDDSGAAGLPISRVKRRQAMILLAIWMLLTLGIGWLLDHYTDSRIPYQDALTTAGGIVATWMLARKILEHWILWIVVDAISIGLYIWQDLYATAVLFAVYVIMAIVGYRQWLRDWRTAG